MLGNIIKRGAAALFMTLITVNQAFAWCLFGGIGTSCGSETTNVDGGGAAAAPEFDGPGAIAAIALLASVGVLLFYRLRQR